MPGVPREFAEHALNVFTDTKPVKQSIRRLSEPRAEAIGKEINRLLAADFIREIKESKWLANTVMVPKKDTDILRMCVDFTSLNKHCPKDHFPLPRIDQIIDSTAGCEKLSFLDAYSGYNQIRLKVEDQEKTAFITPFGVFCYNTMPFGLKNAGATYQRCMQACLKDQIGRNVQVYVDDIVIKPRRQEHLSTISARRSTTLIATGSSSIQKSAPSASPRVSCSGTSSLNEGSKRTRRKSKLS